MRWSSDRPGRSRASQLLAALSLWGCVQLTAGAQDGEDDKPEEAGPASNVQVLDVYFPEDLARNLQREGGWLAAYVELKTTGTKAETVILESVVNEGKTRAYEAKQTVDVAPGAPRRAWAYFRVKPDGDRMTGQTLHLTVRDANGRMLRQERGWQGSASGNPLSVLVVVEKTGIDISPWPGELAPRRGGHDISEAVAACPARKLPDRVEGFHGISCVVFRNLSDTALEPAQLEALRAWVALGGHVILVPDGRSGEIFHTTLAKALLGDRLAAEPRVEHDFRPLELHFVEPGRREAAVEQALDTNDRIDFPADRSYTRIDPLVGQGERELYSKPGRAERDDEGQRRRLFSESSFGRGTVGVLTIDDQAHRTAETGAFLQAMWWYIASPHAGTGNRFAAAAAQTVAKGLTERLKEKRDVGIGFLVALITGYLLLVGPILYFILRKLRRLPSVIWAEPLLVVLYLGIIFATAYITKGVLTTTRQYAILTQQRGVPLAFRESFLAIFAAAETTFRIGASPGSLLLPLYENEKEEQVFRLTRARDDRPSLEEQRLAQWQGGYAASLATVDLGGDGVAIDDLTVTNHLPFPIREGILRHQDAWWVVPAVQPGQSVQAAVNAADDKAFEEKWRLLAAAFAGSRWESVVFAAFLARDEADWTVDVRTTLKERKDLYLLHD